MFAAMSSRAPVGGIKARYRQVVEAVAEDIEAPYVTNDADEQRMRRDLAEDRLCEYPIHPKVQKFFDDFVGKYGHSSILELVT